LQRNIPPPSSGAEHEPSKKPAGVWLLPISADFLQGLFIPPEDGGGMFLQNDGLSELHCITAYKTVLFKKTAY
jgi:hypothetical protein